MEKAEQYYIDHEVRIKSQESLQKSMMERLEQIDAKMDNQFKWIMGTIITFFGGIILHIVQLM